MLNKIVIDTKTIRKMFAQLSYIMNKKQKVYSVFLFFVILVGAGMETLGISAIIPFIQSLMSPQQLMENEMLKPILKSLKIENTELLILAMGILIISVYILKNLYLVFSTYLQTKFRYSFQKELSVRMLESYLKRPYTYFLKVNSAEILRGINGDVIGVFGIFEYSFKMIAEILTIICIAIFLLYTDFFMAIGTLVVASLCFLVVTSIFRNLLKGKGEQQRSAQTDANKYAYQAINGVKEIKVMNREAYFVSEYKMAYDKLSSAEQLLNVLNGCPERIIEATCISCLIGLVCIRLSMGVAVIEFVPRLAVFAMAAFRILPSISRMIGFISGLIFQRPALEMAYLNLMQVEEFEHAESEYANAKNQENTKTEVNFQHSVVVDNIAWKYEGGDECVLENLSIKIGRGESIALIGPSGAGKTTLADILLGLFRVEYGDIKMDGLDIRNIPMQWAKIIGYVPQSIFLIDDTIRNNIAFGVQDEIVEDHLIWRALEQAQLAQFVRGLPDGLNTILGERGVKFSGGQRQRVAIARALYYDPQILVLDEATAALDNETEEMLMESIDALQGHKTLIIVAHRLTTIKKCDKIYQIKDKKATLMSKEEVFKAGKEDDVKK